MYRRIACNSKCTQILPIHQNSSITKGWCLCLSIERSSCRHACIFLVPFHRAFLRRSSFVDSYASNILICRAFTLHCACMSFQDILHFYQSPFPVVYILLDSPLYTKEHPPKFERLRNPFESRQLYAKGKPTVLSASKGDSWRGQGHGGRRGPGRQLETNRDEISSRATQCTMDIDT